VLYDWFEPCFQDAPDIESRIMIHARALSFVVSKILGICIQELIYLYPRSVNQILLQDNRIILYLNFQDLLTYLYPRSWPRSYLQDVRLG
jgi:hypothetical protein